MALQSTLHRFKIELSDIDRSIYEPLDIRLAMHPSESPLFLVTRVLAYALNFERDLEFSAQGLGDPDQAPLSIADPRGGFKLWIEIGSPTAKRLHMAAKLAAKVKVYNYKDPRAWLLDMQSSQIFEFEKIDVFVFASSFLQELAGLVERNNEWSLIVQDWGLTINFKNHALQGEIQKISGEHRG